MRCTELKAFRWWLMFERARRFEARRGWWINVMMAESELNLHESHIHSEDLVERVLKIKQNRRH